MKIGVSVFILGMGIFGLSMVAFGQQTPEPVSVAQLTAVSDLPLSLRPIGGTDSAADREDLAAALGDFRASQRQANIDSLLAFVTSHPASVWTPSVRLNLGFIAYNNGRFSYALNLWKDAWEGAKNDESLDGKTIADRALAEYGRMLARIGEKERLEEVLDVASARALKDSAEILMSSNREALWMMKNNPGVAFRCGPLALSSICKTLNIPIPQGYLDSTRSTASGFSLKEVKTISGSLGLNYQAAFRQPGSDVLVPSVVHWKLNHYGAIIKELDGKYLMVDPTFRSEHWITKETLDEEGSGYFLVRSGALPAGWSVVGEEASSHVFGKGVTSGADSNQTGDDSQKCKDKKCEKGMPDYNFDALLASLTVSDEPIPYTPAFGPDIPFKLSYNQREANLVDPPEFTHFSPRWMCSWISYVEVTSSTPATPSSPPTTVIRISLSGGGSEGFSGVSVVKGPKALQSSAVAVATSSGGNDYYERLLPDGSKQVYGPIVAGALTQKIFLKRVVDPQGNAMEFTYDTAMPGRLMQVSYADGRVFSLSYENSSDSKLVTKISDSFGRHVTFAYGTFDGKVRLSGITDVIGLQSTFDYLADGSMKSLETPYGKTSFTYGVESGGSIRWVAATDPNGDTERAQLVLSEATGVASSAPSNEEPSVPGVTFINNNLQYRNTFYWSKKAWMENPGDYSKAKVFHWLHLNESITSGIVESIKLPYASRIWFRYQGNDSRFISGDSNPTAVVQNVETPAGGVASMFTRYEYQDTVTTVGGVDVHSNPFGLMTKSVDPVGRETTVDYVNEIDPTFIKRKNGSTYDTLVEYQYDSAYPAHRPKTIIGANGQSTTFTYNTRGRSSP